MFVSGEIATNNPGDMGVRPPVATLGVRGTKVGGRGDQEGELNTITLLPDEDGAVGQLEVYQRLRQRDTRFRFCNDGGIFCL